MSFRRATIIALLAVVCASSLAACAAVDDGDGLNPQPLPPKTETPGDDKNAAGTAATGGGGGGETPPVDAPSAADAADGATDGGAADAADAGADGG